MITTTQEQDRLEIAALLQRRTDALAARDAGASVTMFAGDAARYTLAPPLVHTGADAAQVAEWMATFDGPIGRELQDPQMVIGDDVAFVHGLGTLTATPAGVPDAFRLWFRLTLGLRRVDGSWVVVHEHESVPFHMDGSFRAAIDLQPE